MKNTNTRKLVESALMLAVATVLSICKIADLPYGGSITLASMLPIVLISYRNGLGWGLGTGLAGGTLQLLLGLKNLSYFSTPGSIIAIILLDYLVAFAVYGLGGLFRNVSKKQNVALVYGTALACVLRYFSHVISGATVWAGLSIPTSAALGYSFIYNATYMIPETIVTVLAAYYIGSLIDFREATPTRMRADIVSKDEKKEKVRTWIGYAAALLVFAALAYDVAATFAHLQDAETGTFSVAMFVDSKIWIPILIVTFVTAIIATVLYVLRAKIVVGDVLTSEKNGLVREETSETKNEPTEDTTPGSDA